MPKNLGPDGYYPLGTPYDATDQGHMSVHFEVIREQRRAVLFFGTLLDWFILTPPTADAFCQTIRQDIVAAFGNTFPYDAAKMRLPVRADRKRGVVEVCLPAVGNCFSGDPEFWLALTDRIEDARKRLP